MSAMSAVQKAIKARLEAASVAAPVLDNVPREDPYPRIVFGETSLAADNFECITGRSELLRLNIHSRDDGRMQPCKALVDQVWSALDEAVLSLDDPYAAASECQLTLIRIARQPDGKTVEGVLLVALEVQDLS